MIHSENDYSLALHTPFSASCKAVASGQFVDGVVLDVPVDDPVGELAATKDRSFLGGVGVRAAEGAQPAIAPDK